MSNWDDYATIRETVRNKLLMPYAGYRPSNNASIVNLGQIGRWSSSSPFSVDSTYFLVLDKDRSFRMDYLPRAYAFSVRCFYNQYTEYWATTATEITNINISWITNPIIWQQPTVAWLTVTSTPENAIDLDSVLVPAWRASDNWTDNGYRNLIHDQSGISWSRPPFNKTPLFYFIRIIFTPKDWYTLAENYTVTANDWYSSIRTWKSDNLYNPLPGSSLNDPGSQNKYSAWLNYIHVIYNTADIPEVTPVTNISITWITLPVGWATPTLEWIESQTDWVSVVQSRPFDGWAYVMIRFDVEWWHEQYDSFIAWKIYRLYMPLVISDGYTLTDWYTASFSNYNATVDYNTNQLIFELFFPNLLQIFLYHFFSMLNLKSKLIHIQLCNHLSFYFHM